MYQIWLLDDFAFCLFWLRFTITFVFCFWYSWDLDTLAKKNYNLLDSLFMCPYFWLICVEIWLCVFACCVAWSNTKTNLTLWPLLFLLFFFRNSIIVLFKQFDLKLILYQFMRLSSIVGVFYEEYLEYFPQGWYF